MVRRRLYKDPDSNLYFALTKGGDLAIGFEFDSESRIRTPEISFFRSLSSTIPTAEVPYNEQLIAEAEKYSIVGVL